MNLNAQLLQSEPACERCVSIARSAWTYSNRSRTPVATLHRRLFDARLEGVDASVTWFSLLVTVLVVGQLLLGLLTDLGRRDLALTQAAAEKALRRLNKDP